MQISPQNQMAKNLYFPQKITLSEEEKFLAQVRRGETETFTNEEVLEELNQVLGLE